MSYPRDPVLSMRTRVLQFVGPLGLKLEGKFDKEVLAWATGDRGFKGTFTKEFLADKERYEIVMKELDLLEALIPNLTAHELLPMLEDGGGFSATRIEYQINHFQREHKLSLLYTRLILVQTTALMAPTHISEPLKDLCYYDGEEVTRHEIMIKRAVAVAKAFTEKFKGHSKRELSQWAKGQSGFEGIFTQDYLDNLDHFEVVMMELELLDAVIHKTDLAAIALLAMLKDGGGFSASHIRAQINVAKGKNELTRLRSRLIGVQKLVNESSPDVPKWLRDLFTFEYDEIARHYHATTHSLSRYHPVARRYRY